MAVIPTLRVKPQPMVTNQLLDATHFPLKPHTALTVQSPRYVVLGVHTFNQKGAGAASTTNQNHQLQEDSCVVSRGLWCPDLAVNFLSVRGWGFNVCFFPTPKMKG